MYTTFSSALYFKLCLFRGFSFFQNFIIFSLFVCICDLAYLQMAGDMEQQIPAISVPMPGKDPAELKVKCGESCP